MDGEQVFAESRNLRNCMYQLHIAMKLEIFKT